MEEYKLKPIGTIYTPFKNAKGTPVLGGLNPTARGKVEVFREYAKGLADIEGFSHVILVYLFHEAEGYVLMQKPFLDDVERGIFASRHPKRPNHIGLTVVKLEKLDGNILHVAGVDMLDGTPLLDIKPYIPEFDLREGVRVGWLEGKNRGGPRGEKTMKLGIVIYSGDAETIWNAFRLGNFALKQGDNAKIFLLGKGVECESADSEKFDVNEQMTSFARNGGQILACGSCLKIRHSEGSELCPLSTMKDLYDMIKESDKVVAF